MGLYNNRAQGKGLSASVSIVYGISFRSELFKIAEASIYARRHALPISKLPTTVVILVVFSVSSLSTLHGTPRLTIAFKGNIAEDNRTTESRYYATLTLKFFNN